MIYKKTFTVSLVSSLLFSFASSAQMAASLKDNKVVRDNRGNPVVSYESGNCVRTKWETTDNTNPCGHPQREVAVIEKPQRTATKARILKTNDRTVYFGFDNDQLNGEAKTRLDKLAKVLKGSQDVRSADIVGFADKIGSDSYNLDLSKRRAISVKNYLANKGYINTTVAEVRGLGETISVTDCSGKTSDRLINCLSPDRRVEVEVRFTDEVTVYH